ncbi:hypothetical protein PRVXH_002474 [Proteinivorax hydrogeniformans]|uniref:Lipoprotein n=1 Tax=Proteinivorax hydrogeniformans TaxID=1826727 RepID=A0AAU8HTG3_9FIRM
MKKFLSLFFVLILSMAVFVGCGGDYEGDFEEEVPPVEDNGGVDDDF